MGSVFIFCAIDGIHQSILQTSKSVTNRITAHREKQVARIIPDAVECEYEYEKRQKSRIIPINQVVS